MTARSGGNPSPDYDGSARPGANLFTNATVALDLETGALRWYYQAIHHDLWDWDHVTGPVLFDVAHGGSSFGSPAFSPRTGLLYVTGKNAAVSMIVKPRGDSLEPGPRGDGHTANFEELSRIPAYPPTTTLTAYEPASGEEVWQQVLPSLTPIGASGNLATAGDLVFQGTDDGGFYAFHAATGEQLFKHAAPRPIRSSPMTYQVNGRQYVTVVATNTVLTFALP